MKRLFSLWLFLLAGSGWASPTRHAQPDTLPAKTQHSAPPVSRQAPRPMILPGTRLDTNFGALPAQHPAVGKAVPAWLRAKASGSPVYVLNGNVATVPRMKALRQTDVVSIEVLTGSRAAALHGKNARKGLVIITTRNESAGYR